MAATINKKKERGILLSMLLSLEIAEAILVLCIAYPFIYGFIYVFARYGKFTDISNYAWVVFIIVTSIAQFVAMYGIWKWRRWGVYLLIPILLIISIFTSDIRILTLKPNYLVYYIEKLAIWVVWLCVWFWALKRKWRYFE